MSTHEQQPLGDLRGLKCPLCGYDLTGLSESRCPECGREFDAALLRQSAEPGPRPRHRWVRLTVAMSLFILEAFTFMAAQRNSDRIPEVVSFASFCIVPVVLMGLIVMSSYWATWGLLRRDAGEKVIHVVVVLASAGGLVFWVLHTRLLLMSAG